MSDIQEALALHAAGRTSDALILLFNAIAGTTSLSPDRAGHRGALASMLEGVALTSGNEVVERVLGDLLRDAEVDPQLVARSVIGILSSRPSYSRLEQLATVSSEELDATLLTSVLRAWFADPLLTLTLRRVIVSEPRAERVCTFARRSLLAVLSNGGGDPWQWEAVAALAHAAAAGEYAWSEAADETEFVNAASGHLNEWLSAADCIDRAGSMAPLLLLLLMYRRASTLSSWARLAALDERAWGAVWSVHLGPLMATEVIRPLQQRTISESLPSLGDSTDDVSARVRAMYESHPYPRWHGLSRPRVTSVASFIRETAGRTHAPADPRILIAGCGTGRQAAHTALSFPEARLLAMDLSRASLGYAAFMVQELGIANVQFVQGDLLRLDEMHERFDLVFCSGVLHHLADPMTGWRALLPRLHPAGVMKVALYSSIARESVTAARALVQAGGFTGDDDGVRACRAALLSLPAGHPARPVTDSTDFYSLSGCRDLVMHVQECTYRIAELEHTFASLDLRFLGFQVPRSVLAAFTRMHPAAGAALDLGAWAAFEEKHPLTFWGMYQFFVEHHSR